jgi:formamidopyrimidine-DNA glycosylase
VPELPDVEAYGRFLTSHASGRRVERVVVTDAGILREIDPRALDRALRGERFADPRRHGKWLLARTSGPTVVFHFGMTGSFGWGESAQGRHRHDRVIFELDRGELRYRNMRKLGGLWLAHDDSEAARIMGRLGPDALTLDRAGFDAALGRRRGRVKAVLMDQTVVAGLGNLLVDEILWQSRLHPALPLQELTAEERRRLHRTMRRVVRTSVERFDYIPAMRGWLNRVRGRPGARCPRCRTGLERTVIGGRTTWFCPACQPHGAPR